jgi:glycosyltransferase involved in cell wall biosynthesis/polysaccharide pyruvyl transferase WcaK-like protein
MVVKSIALFYGHVARNVGDIAINRGEVALLKSAYPKATINVVLLNATNSKYLASSEASFGPKGTVRLIQASSSDADALNYAMDPGRWLKDCGVEDADLIVLAAGEHLFSYEANPNSRSLFWRILPAFAARYTGKHCLVMPSTFGPYETARERALIGQLLETQPRIAARDVRSLKELEAFGSPVQIDTMLDPAFFLEPPAISSVSSGPRKIGLVMRSQHWGLRLSTENRVAFKAGDPSLRERDVAFQFSLALTRKVLAESDLEVRMFLQTDADRSIVDAVADALGNSPEASRFMPIVVSTIDEYMAALSAVECVVASRFHALILAMVAGRPGFGLYFDVHGHKIPGLMELLEQPDQCLNLSRTPLTQAVDTVYTNCIEQIPNFEGTQRRVEELRRQTRNWLSAEWRSEASPDRLLLSGSHALLELGSSLVADVRETERRKFSSQAYRLKQEMRKAVVRGTQDEAERQKLLEAARRTDERIEASTVKNQALEQELNEMTALVKDGEIERKKLAQAAKRGAERVKTLSEKYRILEQELNELTALVNDGEAERQKLAQAAKRDADLIGALTAEKEALQAEHNRSISNTRATARRLLAMERRIEHVESSTSFRLGAALIAAAKSPKDFWRLPREIWGIYDDYRRRNAVSFLDRSNLPVDGLGGATKDVAIKPALVKVFEEQGLAGVASYIEAQHPADKTAHRNALIAASKALAEQGFLDVELELLRKAVATDESDAALRALYWAAQRKGDILTAWDSIRQLQRFYGTKPNPTQRAFLDKLRRSAAYQLSLFEKIPERPERALSPIRDRICYVLHNSLPYSSGGYATRAQGLALGLREAGFEVVVLTRPGFPTDAKPELTAAEIPLEDTIEGIVYRRLLKPSRIGSSPSEYIEAAADALTEAFAEIRPSIVMAASNYQTALPALIAARRLGLPFFYEIRGFWEITRISREPEFADLPAYKVQELLEGETAKRANHVFTLTGPMKQEIMRRGVAPEHITLLPNSCELERFTPRSRDAALASRLGIPDDIPVIGYIGTFVQYEGLELLVAAVAQLRQRGHVFRLLLVGNENVSGHDVGPITTEIRRIAQESHLEGWLIMPGRVPHEDVEAYYSLIDIAPFPRKAQPVTEMVSPMKPLEAYAMEKAVVVSSVGALLEMVEDGRTGLVFEKDDVESLADILARLISDPQLRGRLGREGRRWVKAERTWAATARIAAEKIKMVTEQCGTTSIQANFSTGAAQDEASGKS